MCVCVCVGMEDHLEPEDCPAYAKRPKPGRHVNKKVRDRRKNRGDEGEGQVRLKEHVAAHVHKIGHFYDAFGGQGAKKRRKREGGFSKEKTVIEP
jgi:hypothetical protein